MVSGNPAWNRVGPNAEKWWATEGVRQFPGLCYTSEPDWADYVVFWFDAVAHIPYTFSVPVPQTTYSSGMVNVYGSGGFATGTYSGTSTTTQMQTYGGTRTEWNVTTVVVPVESNGAQAVLGTPRHWADKVGRWRWSKPDKDTCRTLFSLLHSSGNVGVSHSADGKVAALVFGVLY
jgi:hypothetical protein